MDSYEDKINNLTDRIKVIDDKILDLTQTKINLMMLKRDFNQQMCKTTLEECFTDELKELLNKRFNEEES
jgi:hypothetical protein